MTVGLRIGVTTWQLQQLAKKREHDGTPGLEIPDRAPSSP
jgi:hypothetical protein